MSLSNFPVDIAAAAYLEDAKVFPDPVGISNLYIPGPFSNPLFLTT